MRDVDVVKLGPDYSIISEYLPKEVFQAYEADNVSAWAERYDTLWPDGLGAVFSKLQHMDLVVGFELSPTVKRFVAANGRTYINLQIHPVRYLRDLCIGMTTNSDEIQERIDGEEISPDLIDAEARRLRALFRRMDLPSCHFPDMPFLIGQTPHDSSLISNRRISTWRDHKEKLTQCLKDFENVAFFPHPYNSENIDLIDFFRVDLNKTVVVSDVNSYSALLSHSGDMKQVITLSSSLGVEAATFGFEVDFLLHNPCQGFYVEGVDIKPMTMLGHGVLSKAFWEECIWGRVGARKKTPAFGLGDGYLRDSYDTWSYAALKGNRAATARKTVYLSGAKGRDDLAILYRSLSCEDDEALGVSDLGEKAKLKGIELNYVPAPAKIGDSAVIDFSSRELASLVIRDGFHEIESWGVWAGQLCCRLAFPVVPNSHAILKVELAIGINPQLLQYGPVLRIESRDAEIGFALFRPNLGLSTRVAFEIPCQGAETEVRLHISHLAQAGPTDGRELGYCITEIRYQVGRGELAPDRNMLIWNCADEPLRA
jgi:hypothetical protein